MSRQKGVKSTQHVSAGAPLSSQALLYMLLLAIQFGIQPILTKRYISQTCNTSSCRSSVVVVQEALKFVVAFLMLLASGDYQSAVKDWTLVGWVAVAGLPSALYCIQNLSALLAYQNLDPLTFNVLNQTKTLSAAFCCWIVMGRKQSKVQMISLLVLLLAALIMEGVLPLTYLISLKTYLMGNSGLPEVSPEIPVLVAETIKSVPWHAKLGELFSKLGKKREVIPPEPIAVLDDNSIASFASSRHFTHGVLPVFLASFLSGLAGALTQQNLQINNRNSYLFSMELCAASLIILTVSLSMSEDGKILLKDGFFQNWTATTLIPIFTNSLGGIIVGLVTKHAGSVRKGFALVFGIFLSGMLQALFLTNAAEPSVYKLSTEQIAGGTLVALALLMHCMNPYVQPTRELSEYKTNGISDHNGKATNGAQTPNEMIKSAIRTRKSKKED